MLRFVAFLALAVACAALVVIAMGVCVGLYMAVDAMGPSNALMLLCLATAAACALIAWDVRKVTLTPDEPQAFR